ncbi:MAG TPA: SCO family protein [Shinella sp.]|jgi:protein SCO1/2|uniref:SCO family protein n=1 Tax=Shinella TaxID=323620 RepID=UPI001F566D89|nr:MULTISPECIES: SCO family protein [Shinella]MDC7260246.1 SCO family protein [Shinella sp. YE25]CAI0341780.1 putative Cytochrome oxidase biogenesis protein Sco1/SenC/PrrC, copper metallochaperone [Rhizobiaceae bacterium]CAK7262244.1 protein SCO1 [Shinella sp. WSC3-e]HEV7251364.1 SCO family protein [Shinella sp.]
MTSIYSRRALFGSAIAALLVGGLVSGALVLANMAETEPTGGIGGPFELTSHRGEAVSDRSLRGRPYLAFFGFTHCPDICPTTLFELTDLMKELGPQADAFNALLISVDPERDTQNLLSLYMEAFDPRIIAVRGTRKQTDQALSAFRATAKRVDTEGGSYTMDHTAGIFLMDADGRFQGMLDMHEPRETRLKKLRNLAEVGGA